MKRFMNRRAFVRTGASLAAALPAVPALARAATPSRPPSLASQSAQGSGVQPMADPDVMQNLALRAVDAAKAAGATYADARLTRDVTQVAEDRYFNETETHGIGVRALVNGAWGFTASSYWDLEEATRLAQEAVAQARENGKWISDRAELVSAPVTRGDWITPHKIDPFSIPPDEKMDFTTAMAGKAAYLRTDYGLSYWLDSVVSHRQDRTVATTEGSLFNQAFLSLSAKLHGYVSIPGFDDDLVLTKTWQQFPSVALQQQQSVEEMRIKGSGWEALSDANIPDMGLQFAERVHQRMFIPSKPVDIGRSTIVADAKTLAGLVAATVGIATDLDRIVGIEANAGGTSYLGTDPLQLLGKFSYGSELLSVQAQSLGLRKWDDEGIEPATFPLVTKGILNDFGTTRDRAMWLAPAYAKLGRPMRSNGCATSSVWSDETTGGSPGLAMAPGKDNATFDDLVRQTTHGLALFGCLPMFDYQIRQIVLAGEMREIVNGRLGAFVRGGAIIIDSAQLWKNLLAIGGPNSVESGQASWEKGQPSQTITVNVSGVPGMFKDMPVVDLARKA